MDVREDFDLSTIKISPRLQKKIQAALQIKEYKTFDEFLFEALGIHCKRIARCYLDQRKKIKEQRRKKKSKNSHFMRFQ